MYSEISAIEEGRIKLRGRDLTSEVMGHLDFTEAIHMVLLGEPATPPRKRVLDAVLVSLMDHGVTSSTLVARMTYRAAPEAFQGAVAAGVLNSGGRVLGSMEGCGRLLAGWVEQLDTQEVSVVARELVDTERASSRRIPGLGHGLHEEGDARAERLFEIAREAGLAGQHVDLLLAVQEAATQSARQSLSINVTGAIAAVVLDLGFPWEILRGFGIISRVPGLVAHLGEEAETGTVQTLLRRLQRDETIWDQERQS